MGETSKMIRTVRQSEIDEDIDIVDDYEDDLF